MVTPAHFNLGHLTATLEDRILRVSRVIARDFNMTITFAGEECSCAPQAGGGFHLNLPAIPDNPSEEYLKSLDGFLDHEAGHAKSTDFTVVSALYSDPEERLLLNILEDYRIEELMGEYYPGSRMNLDFMNDMMRTKLEAEFVENPPTGWRAAQLSVFYLRYQWPLHPSLAEVGAQVDQIVGHLIKDCESVISTQGLVPIVKEMARLLRQASEQDPPDPQGSSGSEDNGDSSGSEDNGDSSGSEDNGDSDSSEKGDSDSSEKGDSDSSEKGDSDSSEKGDSGGSEDNGDSDSSEKGDSGNPKDSESPEESAAPPSLDLDLSDSDTSMSSNYRESFIENWTKEMTTIDGVPMQVRPYDRSLDTIQKQNTRRKGAYSVPAQVNVAASKLASLVKSETSRGWDTGRDRGRIHTAGLYRLNTDSRVFKRQESSKIDTDVVFCVGVDVSGSMQGSYHAVLVNIFEILGRAGFVFMAFTYTTNSNETSYRPEGRSRLQFTRYSGVDINILKDYTDAYIPRRNFLGVDRCHLTPTPDAYEFGMKFLHPRPESKKVFINVTDGSPCMREHGTDYLITLTKNMQKLAEGHGIGCVNVGYNVTESFKREVDPNVLLTSDTSFYTDFVNLVSQKVRGKSLRIAAKV